MSLKSSPITRKRWSNARKVLKNTLKRPVGRRRRKKGELTRIKAQLWQICRQIKSGTTCYTCGRQNLTGSNRQLGHYIASSLCSVELRYDLKNLEIQCYNCNINKSGNTIQFQINLRFQYGKRYVDELWERNLATKGKTYPITFFQEKIEEYSHILSAPKSIV